LAPHVLPLLLPWLPVLRVCGEGRYAASAVPQWRRRLTLLLLLLLLLLLVLPRTARTAAPAGSA